MIGNRALVEIKYLSWLAETIRPLNELADPHEADVLRTVGWIRVSTECVSAFLCGLSQVRVAIVWLFLIPFVTLAFFYVRVPPRLQGPESLLRITLNSNTFVSRA